MASTFFFIGNGVLRVFETNEKNQKAFSLFYRGT